MRWATVGLVLLVGCSSGPRGLGRAACPYLRPRLIRVDTDRAGIAAGTAAAAADLSTVAEDVADYVRTNLPHGGTARSDQPLVGFSRQLTLLARDPTGSSAAFLAAEARLKRECRVPGY